MNKLYPLHVPTTTFQKILLAAGSAAMAISNPRRGDMVATFGETTAWLALPNIKKRMESDIVGREILANQPRMTNKSIDRAYLASLPDRTLGREYCRFLDKLDTSPDERPPVRFIDDLDLLYVMQRYRETHDFFHVLLEMPTTMLGEVAVKWFEGIQFGLPMSVTGGLFGAARLYPKQRVTYVETLLPWIIRNARNGQFLMNVYWEKHWEQSLDELQKAFGFEQPPSLT